MLFVTLLLFRTGKPNLSHHRSEPTLNVVATPGNPGEPDNLAPCYIWWCIWFEYITYNFPSTLSLYESVYLCGCK